MSTALKTTYEPSLDSDTTREFLPEGAGIGSKFAYRFGELIQLLRHQPSALFNDLDRDYAPEVFSLLNSLAKFLQDKSLHKDILEFFASFETVNSLKPKDITTFLKLLQSFEDHDEPAGLGETKKKFGKAELLRSLFHAFGVTQRESVGGVKTDPSNFLLNRFISGLEGFSGKLYIDHDSILSFSPTESDAQIFTHLKPEIATQNEGLIIDLSVPIIDKNIKLVDEIVINNVSGTVQEIVANLVGTSEGEKELSYPKAASIARRRRQSEGNAKIRTEKEQISKQTQYDDDLERLHTLGMFISSELSRLQEHLLESIPFVGEVIDYLSYYEKLQKQGYIDEKANMLDVPKHLHHYNEALNASIVEMRKEKIQLEQELALILDTIQNSTLPNKKLKSHIDRTTAKIKRLENRILEHETESAEIVIQEIEIGQIISRFRFMAGIPTREEFKVGLYKSLRAADIEVPMQASDDQAVTYAWIAEHILSIFTGLVGSHFSQEGIDLQRVERYLQEVDNLSPVFSEDAKMPHTEGLSQIKISKFMDALLRVIPKDFLAEVPIIRTKDENLDGKPKANPTRRVLEKSPRKTKPTHQDERNAKTENNLKKEGLLEGMKNVEKEMEKYLQYWLEREQSILKKIRKINNDIDLLGKRINLRSLHHKGSSLQDLDDLKNEWSLFLGEVRHKLNDTVLVDNQSEYDGLLKTHSSIQAQIKRIR